MSKQRDDLNEKLRQGFTKRRKTVNWFEDDETDRPRRERRPMPKPSNGKEARDDRTTDRPPRRE